MAPALLPTQTHPGVFLREKDILSNSRKVATYLKQSDTKSLRSLLEDNKDILQEFKTLHDSCFNNTGPNQKAMKTVALRSVLQTWDDGPTKNQIKNAHTMADLCANEGSTNGKMVYTMAIRKLHAANPNVFNDTDTPFEDVSRGFCLIKYWLRTQIATRKTKKKPKSELAMDVIWF